jgi:predicted nucleotidyltransferase
VRAAAVEERPEETTMPRAEAQRDPKRALATRPEIEALVADIAARFEPERVVLFGSYARGEPGPDSDVELLVIMPTALTPIKQAVRIA